MTIAGPDAWTAARSADEMRYLSIALACAGLVTAIWAAYRWLKASKVRLPDTLIASETDLPKGTHGPHVTVNALVETHAALVKASELNASAAFWTGVSALLNGSAAIVGILI
jgi:hypothetical protein